MPEVTIPMPAAVVPSTVVLPCAPHDVEKTMYVKTHRWILTLFGLFSFLSLCTGMVLFVRASVYFYWYGAFFGMFTVYLLVSYVGIGMWGKDFDFEEHANIKGSHDDYRPTVDVFLPVCKEPLDVLENTWKHVSNMDWPHFRVHVLDDGACDNVAVMAGAFGFNYIVRDNRPELKKAGNLRYAFVRTDGELIVILDADFCPRPDFLKETVPYFAHDPKIAIVQTPQFFRVRNTQTWVEQGAGITQELFYRMVQTNRNRFGASICVGSCSITRREALVPFGGTAPIGYSEDVHTGWSVINAGWRLVYMPVNMAMGVCPDTLPAFFLQQYRWAMGSTTLLLNFKGFWRSKLPFFMVKLCYLSGMMYYTCTALGIFVNPLPASLLIWIKPDIVLYYNIAFALPSVLYSGLVMKLWCRQKYGWAATRVRNAQNYAHLFAIKDKLFNTMLEWVPTGGQARGKRVNKFKQAQILCILWTVLATASVITGTTYRILGGYTYWNFIPSVVLATVNFVNHLDFMLCSD